MNLTSLLTARSLALQLFPPVESTENWQLSDFEAAQFVDCYPPLHLKSGYRLLVYCNAWGGNCSTLLYAVPEDSGRVVTELSGDPNHLDVNALLAGRADERPYLAWALAAGAHPHQLIEPRPVGALSSFMEAIGGDDTPLAYLQAAWLARDGKELGASWHGCSWRAHAVLAESPFLPPEKLLPLLGLFQEYLKTTPIDPFDIYCKLVPDGFALRRKYRQKLRRGKTPEVNSETLFQRIAWDQNTLSRALREACNIYYNDNHYYEFAGNDYPLPDELAAFAGQPDVSSDGWTWQEPLPQEFLQVELSAGAAVVTFYTWTALHQERILRHVSRFQRGHYHPTMEEHLVGTGPGGYIH